MKRRRKKKTHPAPVTKFPPKAQTRERNTILNKYHKSATARKEEMKKEEELKKRGNK